MPTIRTIFSALLLTSAAVAAADDHPAQKYKFELPPAADLGYTIKAKQNGFSVDGEAKIRWSGGEQQYQIATESRAMLVGKILDAKSEGRIDEYGLAPATFNEKRFRKDATTTTFNRDSKSISFSTSDESYPLKGGEQDRNSAVWQLIGVARAAGARVRVGTEWSFFVAGQRDAEPWTFRVMKQEKISTPLGELDTWRIHKAPPPDRKGQQVDVWLAPGQEWYPVRLRQTDADGDYIEQNLATVNKKGS